MSNQELKMELIRQRNFCVIVLISLMVIFFSFLSAWHNQLPNSDSDLNNPTSNPIGKLITVQFNGAVAFKDLAMMADPVKKYPLTEAIKKIKKINNFGLEIAVVPAHQKITLPILSINP